MNGSGLKAVFFDFDSTISTPIFIERAQKWAVADNVALFQQMDSTERVANLGGAERIAKLRTLFDALYNSDVALFIVSIGHRKAFVPHLHDVGLLGFFEQSRVYGQDSDELRAVNFVKGKLIEQIMQKHGWRVQECRHCRDCARTRQHAHALI
uniref:Phosphoserine phosphatase n=1 Tax=Coccolithus braarudii TaxID=221442 RepID=A0A7S0L8M7_9EUKA|mmetsp:Transcript_26206/g.56553  ORF Transcript_26206/g.56553 Transcript_26206/m.56553 type:complete len:153 (+) Transcript_26206:65-523(+)